MFRRAKYHLPKFEPPQVDGLYARERLFTRLDCLDSKRVIWISAPAGSGKTSLVASYLAQRDRRFIWYEMDAGDGDIASFFYYMAQCIKNAYPRKKGMLPLFTSEYQAGLPSFSVHYFRELFLKIESESVLVLDNFQEAGNKDKLYTVLQAFINEVPVGSQLIIVSRYEPPSIFSTLQAHPDFYHLTMSELWFDRVESDELAELRSDIKLTETQYAQLFQLTKGWATGLILTLKHLNVDPEFLKHQKFTDRLVLFHYVVNEILAEFDKATRVVLFRTAFLKRITVTAAKKLTGGSNTKNILQHLSRNQLLTNQYNHQDGSFEYHPLFKQFLQQQARDLSTKEEIYALLRDTGKLLLEQKHVVDAVDLYIELGDWPHVGQIIKAHAKKLIQDGLYLTIESWLKRVPESTINNDPWLLYWKAASILQYNPGDARELLYEVHFIFLQEKDAFGAYLSYCNIVEAYLQLWEDYNALHNWVAHFDVLKNKLSSPPGLELKARTSLVLLGAMSFVWPDHPGLPVHLRTSERIFRFIPSKQVKGMIGAVLLNYYNITGQYRKMQSINKSISQLLNYDETTIFAKIMVINAMGVLRIYTSDPDSQLIIWKKGLQLTRNTGITFYDRVFMSHIANSYIAKEDVQSATDALDAIEDIGFENEDIFYGYYLFLRGRVSLMEENFEQARNALADSYTIAEKNKFMVAAVTTRMFYSVVLAEQGEFDTAVTVIRETLPVMERMGVHADDVLNKFGIFCFTAYINWLQGDTQGTYKNLRFAFICGRKAGIVSTAFWYGRMYRLLCALAVEWNIEVKFTKKFIFTNKLIPPEEFHYLNDWPWAVKIYTLGRFSILVEDKPIETTSRPLLLLKVVLSYGGRDVSEEEIVDALWPDADGDQARANFKTNLYRLRKLFGDREIILLHNHKITLNQRYCWVDQWALSRLLSKSISASENTPDEIRSSTAHILELYRGHFLSHETAGWVIQPRERLRSKFMHRILQSLQYLELIDVSHATSGYYQVLELDPLIEGAYQGLIRCYLGQGREADALSAYHSCESIFQKKGVNPSLETKKLIQFNDS